MQLVTFDSGIHWDDPNLRWGEPSYLLEPGDPGYAPPLSSTTNQNKKKKSTMRHTTYYPRRQPDQIVWLTNYGGKVGTYAAPLGLTAGQTTATVADCKWLIYLLQWWLPATRSWSQSCTAALNTAQTGAAGGAMTLPVFTAPALPAGTVAVTPGALTRIFTLIQDLKNDNKFTDEIAADLQVAGSILAAPDLNTVQPVITATISGSHTNLGWGWQGNAAFLDSCEIQVDRGDGHGYVLLTIDTTPDYTDTQPFPAVRTVWSYKAIYRVNDAQVGVWSAPVSVVIGG